RPACQTHLQSASILLDSTENYLVVQTPQYFLTLPGRSHRACQRLPRWSQRMSPAMALGRTRAAPPGFDRCRRIPDPRCSPDVWRRGPQAYGLKWVTSGLMRRSKLSDYSITSSASAISLSGTVRPSALAVLGLITRSNLSGRCIGKSLGFAP